MPRAAFLVACALLSGCLGGDRAVDDPVATSAADPPAEVGRDPPTVRQAPEPIHFEGQLVVSVHVPAGDILYVKRADPVEFLSRDAALHVEVNWTGTAPAGMLVRLRGPTGVFAEVSGPSPLVFDVPAADVADGMISLFLGPSRGNAAVDVSYEGYVGFVGAGGEPDASG